MPFQVFRHRDRVAPETGRSTPPEPADLREPPAADLAPIQAFTEERRILGRVRIEGRLSDTLNRRDPVPVFAAQAGPIVGPEPLGSVPELQALDPYDLMLVAAGPESQAALSDEQRRALRTHKTRYDVCLELTGASVCGTVHLYPGTDPVELMGYRPELFVPVTGPRVRVGGAELPASGIDVALVNRAYLRSVELVDRSESVSPEVPDPISSR